MSACSGCHSSQAVLVVDISLTRLIVYVLICYSILLFSVYILLVAR